MGFCSCTCIVSSENTFLSSLDRYYRFYQPVLGAGEFKMSLLPSTNRANTIFKTTVLLRDLLFEQTVLLLWLKKILRFLKKNCTLQRFIFSVSKIYIGLEKIYSFLTKHFGYQFTAALLNRLISSFIT